MVVEAWLVDAVDEIVVVGGVAVGDEDERVVGRAVGLEQVRDVGIDPAGAVVAAGGVAGSVAPGARLAPGEAEAGRMQIGSGDGGHAVFVADGEQGIIFVRERGAFCVRSVLHDAAGHVRSATSCR